MGITMAKARKLLKMLKEKYPHEEVSVDLIFSSWSDEHFTVYVKGEMKISSVHHWKSMEEVMKAYNL